MKVIEAIRANVLPAAATEHPADLSMTGAGATSAVLTKAELRELTGYKRAGEQMAELLRQGFYRARRSRVDGSVIVDFIAQDNPPAAIRMDETCSAAVDRLAEHPLQGRAGQIPGTRELIPHESYRLVYEVRADTIWILTLVHTARQRPPTGS